MDRDNLILSAKTEVIKLCHSMSADNMQTSKSHRECRQDANTVDVTS